MVYQLTVVKKEPNPNFEAQLKEWKDRDRYNSFHRSPGDSDYPQAQIATNALIIELTEEQYRAVKEAVLTTFM